MRVKSSPLDKEWREDLAQLVWYLGQIAGRAGLRALVVLEPLETKEEETKENES